MPEFDQRAYWDQEGTTKTFTHPVNLAWVRDYLEPTARILDYGCGYGRVMGLLAEQGYGDLLGVDFSDRMLEKARALWPQFAFQAILPARVPVADGAFDAVMLFAVLTCIPEDGDQRALLDELWRILRPGGIVYLSDYWLQSDPRNLARYAEFQERYRTFGVFEVSPGVAVRHHSRPWIETLLGRWELLQKADIQVVTMNGHAADGFQRLVRKPWG